VSAINRRLLQLREIPPQPRKPRSGSAPPRSGRATSR
jgi:hypothetical protein